MVSSKLSPSVGHLVTGTAINGQEFEGRVMAAQLFQFAEDPRQTENEGEYRGDSSLEGVRQLRVQVQRMFTGEKKKNVEPYSRYIVGLYRGEVGLTPTIVLWSQSPLDFEEGEDGTARLLIPFTERLIAIDGETQLAARYVAREIEPETAKAWVAIKVCHGRDVNWAKQVFHDLNVLGIQPNAALAIGMDNRDPLTAVARDVEANVPLFSGRVNRQSRQLKARDHEIMTINSPAGALACYACGRDLGHQARVESGFDSQGESGSYPDRRAGVVLGGRREDRARDRGSAAHGRKRSGGDGRDRGSGARTGGNLGLSGPPAPHRGVVREDRPRKLGEGSALGRDRWQVHAQGQVLSGGTQGDSVRDLRSY